MCTLVIAVIGKSLVLTKQINSNSILSEKILSFFILFERDLCKKTMTDLGTYIKIEDSFCLITKNLEKHFLLSKVT